MAAIPERCEDGASGLDKDGLAAMLGELHGDWSVEGGKCIQRVVRARDFVHGLEMLNAVGAAAEEENHHPDVSIRDYRIFTVVLTTHDVDGLSPNDFVMARRVDAIVEG